MGEFDLKNGRVWKGVVGAALASIKYLVIPLLIVTLIVSLVAGLSEGSASLEELDTLRDNLLILAIPVIALGFMVGFYPRGSYSRMTFGVAYAAMICLWLWLATRGGSIELSLSSLGLSLDFTPLLILLILAASLKAIYYLAEARSFRGEFLGEENSAVPRDLGGGIDGSVQEDAQSELIPEREGGTKDTR